MFFENEDQLVYMDFIVPALEILREMLYQKKLQRTSVKHAFSYYATAEYPVDFKILFFPPLTPSDLCYTDILSKEISGCNS